MDVCLQGVARFIESHRDSDRRVTLHYDIVGDGPERSRLELLADRLGVSSFTSFHGARAHSDVIHHLRTSDAFLNHSVVGPDGDEEGIPNVIKEAYLSGLPVIASRHAGIPEVVEHKRTGLLVEEQDAAGIAAALDILYRDPSLRVRYAQRGRRLVREEYDGEVISKRLSQLFSSLLKTNAAERSDYGEG
jgi:glycosyltransferase involved in cell wall biosynthesis